MEDHEIIELFVKRSETAISETASRYGKYCHTIAYNILRSAEDSEECVSDAYLRAWNTIPPQRPGNLAAYLGRITRNLALDRYKYENREKRGGGQPDLALEELEECVSAGGDPAQQVSSRELTAALDRFLAGLPERKRQVFVRRYWYFSSVDEIAEAFDISRSNVKVMLLRTRRELKRYLEQEGVL